MMGEAVVARKGVLKNFFPLVKQHGALLAKGRLLGLQFDELFTDGLYMEIGHYAVSLAMKIKKAFVDKGYEVVVDSPTNQQFFRLPNDVMDSLKKEASFEVWGTRGETHTVVRFVTSWSTPSQDVDKLIALIK
jgi:threonine aldolase